MAFLSVQRTLFYTPLRHLSRAQVSTALRPFYFLVHPDLFSKFPVEQTVNESSCKILSSYLSAMVHDKKIPQPIDATFYLKPRIVQRRKSSLRKVRVVLKDIFRVRDAISIILKAAELPTSYVDSLPDLGDKEKVEEKVESFSDFDDLIRTPPGSRHSTDLYRPLGRWLRDNIDEARERLARCESIRYEVERLQDELCNTLELEDISWYCGWNLLHRRGALDSFNTMAKSHFETVRPILKNRTVVFGDNSGVSISGKVILFSGEVRNNWLNTIKRVPQEDTLLSVIPLVEKALSQQLRDIQIVYREDQLVTLADDYRQRLRHLITNVSDYLSRRSFPDSWPESLSKYQLCVETEAAPLMLSPSGQFIVPASCPGFLLVRFISENLTEAENLLSSFAARAYEETSLVIRCISDLGLIQLERDDSLSSQNMIDCCKRLLSAAPHIRHLTHGSHLVVTRYYSVLSDGVICIPWNFKEETFS